MRLAAQAALAASTSLLAVFDAARRLPLQAKPGLGIGEDALHAGVALEVFVEALRNSTPVRPRSFKRTSKPQGPRMRRPCRWPTHALRRNSGGSHQRTAENPVGAILPAVFGGNVGAEASPTNGARCGIAGSQSAACCTTTPATRVTKLPITLPAFCLLPSCCAEKTDHFVFRHCLQGLPAACGHHVSLRAHQGFHRRLKPSPAVSSEAVSLGGRSCWRSR